MSSEKNSRRINLSFKLSSPDQNKAFSILCGVENKTEFITQLILSNQDVGYDKKGTTTKDLIREALAELLPTIPFTTLLQNTQQTQHPVAGYPTNSAAVDSASEGEPQEMSPDGAEKNQHPSETDADGITISSGDLEFEIPDFFLDSMEDLMKKKEDESSVQP